MLLIVLLLACCYCCFDAALDKLYVITGIWIRKPRAYNIHSVIESCLMHYNAYCLMSFKEYRNVFTGRDRIFITTMCIYLFLVIEFNGYLLFLIIVQLFHCIAFSLYNKYLWDYYYIFNVLCYILKPSFLFSLFLN